MGKLAIFLSAAAALAASVSPAAAQERFFASDAPFQMVLTAPVGDIVRTARRNTDARPATMSLVIGGAAAENFTIQLHARGFTRRTGGYCTFPPLGIDFARDTLAGTSFRGQNHLKIVTHCQSASAAEQRTILEYLAYRLYNTVTPMSFRVRGGRITYHDSDGGSDLTRFGFLIEDVEDVADRNHRVELKVPSNQYQTTQLDRVAAARYALFEYMIGNLDWAYVAGPAGDNCCHNTKLMGASPTATSDIVPVPYDFDYSGFVDAPYAVPPERIPIRNVRQRYYRGMCVSNAALPGVMQEFLAHRSEMLALINGETRLSPTMRTKASRYIEDFFEAVADPQVVEREIVGRCRTTLSG